MRRSNEVILIIEASDRNRFCGFAKGCGVILNFGAGLIVDSVRGRDRVRCCRSLGVRHIEVFGDDILQHGRIGKLCARGGFCRVLGDVLENFLQLRLVVGLHGVFGGDLHAGVFPITKPVNAIACRGVVGRDMAEETGIHAGTKTDTVDRCTIGAAFQCVCFAQHGVDVAISLAVREQHDNALGLTRCAIFLGISPRGIVGKHLLRHGQAILGVGGAAGFEEPD